MRREDGGVRAADSAACYAPRDIADTRREPEAGCRALAPQAQLGTSFRVKP